MSIFETHVKDVVQRQDSDPLPISGRFRKIDDASQLTSAGESDRADNDFVEAKPGEVLVVDPDDGEDDSIDAAVDVLLPEEPLLSGYNVVVKSLSDNANDVILESSSINAIDGNDYTVSPGSSAEVISDGDAYYVV